MSLELIGESDIKKKVGEGIIFTSTKRDKNKDNLKLVPEDDVFFCERRKIGLTDNCALCRESNKEIYSRCTNKGGTEESLW